ncbi:hypothetical protein [Frateuria sp. STR12]|uniref:hypothetical protein n=1 Tax=Frateuria hangzhouensis TaxID=2995589 RepID=UPI002260F186|nr:hypothetical protein [Frateuria sp. STR12]MCX7513449.1 hypothetical protein [Frateuria sp. STR12]
MQTRLSTSQGFALAFALFGLAGVATAQQDKTEGNAGASFESLDTNQDGRLTRSEIPSDMSLLRTRLATYDTNHDGTLDSREYAAAQASLHGSDRTGGDDEDS